MKRGAEADHWDLRDPHPVSSQSPETSALQPQGMDAANNLGEPRRPHGLDERWNADQLASGFDFRLLEPSTALGLDFWLKRNHGIINGCDCKLCVHSNVLSLQKKKTSTNLDGFLRIVFSVWIIAFVTEK